MDTQPFPKLSSSTLLSLHQTLKTKAKPSVNLSLKESVMLQLEAAYPHSLPLKTILKGARLNHPKITARHIKDVLQSLHQAHEVDAFPSCLNPHLKRYQRIA